MVGAAPAHRASISTGALAGRIHRLRTCPSGLLSYGSSGIGSSTHLFGEMFKARTGIDIIHVPYRGQVPALDDLIAGRIGVMFPIMPDVIEATDEVRALALASTEVSGVPSGCAIDAAARLSRSRRLGLDRALRSCANARNGDRTAACIDAGLDG